MRLLFGGATATRTVTVHVWDDSAGTLPPGASLFSGDFEMTGSNDAMQEIAGARRRRLSRPGDTGADRRRSPRTVPGAH